MNLKNAVICAVSAGLAALSCVFIAMYNYNSKRDSDLTVDVNNIVSETQTYNYTAYEGVSDTSKISDSINAANYTKNETVSKSANTMERRTESKEKQSIVFPINLNTATVSELEFIDGIGDVTAENIVNYRDRTGAFKNRRELLNVDGIGEKKLAEIWNYLYVENEVFEEVTEEIIQDDRENYDNHDNNNGSVSVNSPHGEIQTECEQTDGTMSSGELQIDLNKCTKEDLMKVPYLDEEMCDKILELRENLGEFSSTYELLYIDGMTNSLYEQIKYYFNIDGYTDY